MSKRRLLSRRATLRLGLAGLAGASVLAKGCAQTQDPVSDAASVEANVAEPVPATERDFSISDDLPLKDRAAAKGILFGAAAGYDAVSSDPTLAVRYAQECAMLVPENALKFRDTRPVRDVFDFARGDWLVRFAAGHNMQVRGHTLVWNQAIPKWLKETATKKNAERLMVDHIQTTMEHYAGQIQSWDVVNEILDHKSHKLRSSLWFKMLGPDYVELAFRTAAAADPDAMLVLNENWLEYESRDATRRRASLLAFLSQLKDKGVPVQALGIQAHLDGALNDDIDYDDLRRFLADVASLGFKILITELDVRDSTLPFDFDTRDRIIATAYEDYLTTVLDEPAVIAVSTWGLSDRHTWLADRKPRDDGEPPRPLPLDADLNRKLAWNAIARAFDQAPQR